MSVRPAVAEDAGGIASVKVRTWRTCYRGVVPDSYLDAMDLAAHTESWRRWIAEDTVFVAVVEDEVVGFLAMGPARTADCYELYAIYVLPELWGTGIGHELIKLLPDEKTVLWVLAENPRARRFYERQGFAPDGVTQVEAIGGRELEEIRYARVPA